MRVPTESENVILNTDVKSIVTERIPQSREVASGMKNLGNTCYMNAVLQALAHAPELCHAIDSLPHHSVCPIAIQNEIDEKLRQLQKQSQKESKNLTESGSTSTSPLPDSNTNSTNTSKKKSRKKKVNLLEEAGILTGKFCALCEFEKHIVRSHKSGANQYSLDSNMDASSSSNHFGNDSKNTNSTTSSPMGGNNQPAIVIPADFVKGFISDVAPGFKLGVQEDSHEFLRLLIDAMQTCCKNAAQKKYMKSENISEQQIEKQIREEYPFLLFQGTVESSVKCNACKETSITLDPFEDIGLEVTTISRALSCSTSMNSSLEKPSIQLADVPASLERFTRKEQLDAQYKCEKCGVLGSATKQTRLARIPPILTLHLKRFRYGQQSSSSLESRGISSGVNGSSNYGGVSGTSSSHSNNGNNSKFLHNIDFSSSGFGGTSGSAKIEGHIRFDQFFDIRPFLTTELKKSHRAMFCRLFAVIVHTGKNSHSGHYISYVRNLAKNEWWKMDDSRIMRVSTEEVVHSEAYMLFYRVVDHPVAAKLKSKSLEQVQYWRNLEDERKKKEMDQMILIKQNKATNVTDEIKNKSISITSTKQKDHKRQNSSINSSSKKNVSQTNDTSPNCKENNISCSNNSNEHNTGSKKRIIPKYVDGYEWAEKRMKMLDVLSPIIHRIDDKISDGVNFKFEYFQFITNEASAGGKIGCGPSGVSGQFEIIL